MSRPLLITDCDEVLLYMVAHFAEWLGDEHGVSFDLSNHEFASAMRYAKSGEPVPHEEIWKLLNLFFDGQMHRQTPVEGAVDAIRAIREHADVVVLTNLLDFRRDARRAQLQGHGIDVPVYTNQGPKGPALKAILDEYQPTRAVFIDDLPQHHGSVFEVTPHVRRLHLCAEPRIATHISCAHAAGRAHARIDQWGSALPWLIDSLTCEEKDLETHE